MLTSRALQDALDLMSKIENLSSPSQLLRATSWLQLVDLEAASAAAGVESASLLERSKTRYLCAHDWLLSQLEHMGEKIERRFENFKIQNSVTCNESMPSLQIRRSERVLDASRASR